MSNYNVIVFYDAYIEDHNGEIKRGLLYIDGKIYRIVSADKDSITCIEIERRDE